MHPKIPVRVRIGRRRVGPTGALHRRAVRERDPDRPVGHHVGACHGLAADGVVDVVDGGADVGVRGRPADLLRALVRVEAHHPGTEADAQQQKLLDDLDVLRFGKASPCSGIGTAHVHGDQQGRPQRRTGRRQRPEAGKGMRDGRRRAEVLERQHVGRIPGLRPVIGGRAHGDHVGICLDGIAGGPSAGEEHENAGILGLDRPVGAYLPLGELGLLRRQVRARPPLHGPQLSVVARHHGFDEAGQRRPVAVRVGTCRDMEARRTVDDEQCPLAGTVGGIDRGIGRRPREHVVRGLDGRPRHFRAVEGPPDVVVVARARDVRVVGEVHPDQGMDSDRHGRVVIDAIGEVGRRRRDPCRVGDIRCRNLEVQSQRVARAHGAADAAGLRHADGEFQLPAVIRSLANLHSQRPRIRVECLVRDNRPASGRNDQGFAGSRQPAGVRAVMHHDIGAVHGLHDEQPDRRAEPSVERVERILPARSLGSIARRRQHRRDGGLSRRPHGYALTCVMRGVMPRMFTLTAAPVSTGLGTAPLPATDEGLPARPIHRTMLSAVPAVTVKVPLTVNGPTAVSLAGIERIVTRLSCGFGWPGLTSRLLPPSHAVIPTGVASSACATASALIVTSISPSYCGVNEWIGIGIGPGGPIPPMEVA